MAAMTSPEISTIAARSALHRLIVKLFDFPSQQCLCFKPLPQGQGSFRFALIENPIRLDGRGQRWEAGRENAGAHRLWINK